MKHQATRIWLVAMSLLLAGIWSYAVRFHAFDDDEFQHAHVAWLLHHGQRPYADFFEHHLVLYHRLMAPLCRFGEGPALLFMLRGVSLAAAVAVMILLYQAGRRLGYPPLAAAMGIWLLALTPMFVLKMTEARPEPLAMLAFAAACRLMIADGRRPLDDASRLAKRGAAIGLLAGVMALLSQKYVILAGGLLVANFAWYGWRPTMIMAAAFLAAMIAYAGWMIGIGVARDAFGAVVILNLRWRHAFSPAGYLVEMYFTATGLTATGILGLVRDLSWPRRRRPAWALAALLAAAIALVFLVPVPYRQSFLPLLAVLALGAMSLGAAMLRLVAARHRIWFGPTLTVLLGGAALAALPRQLADDNRDDLARMAALAKFAPSGPVFDGRGLMVSRPHLGYHACMHHEILLMIDLEEYAAAVIRALRAAALPPVIADYRVAMVPEPTHRFVAEHYLPTEIPDVLGAGLRLDRLMPGRETIATVPVAGAWRATWQGSAASLAGVPLSNGGTIMLSAGDHPVTATGGLVWDFRLTRDYRDPAPVITCLVPPKARETIGVGISSEAK